jgi:hypothetical protein
MLEPSLLFFPKGSAEKLIWFAKKAIGTLTQEGLRHLWGSTCSGLELLEPFVHCPKTMFVVWVDFV